MYVNSYIPWNADSEKFAKIVEMTYKLGYQIAFVNFNSVSEFKLFRKSEWYTPPPKKCSFPISINSISILKNKTYPIALLPRITVSVNNQHKLKQELSSLAQHNCIIAVESENSQILEIAARDGRVDIIGLPDVSHLKSLTKGIISLAKQSKCILDINSSQLIGVDKFNRSRVYRNFYRLFLDASPHTHLYSLGSYSECNENPWVIRGPKEMAAILSSVFGLPWVHMRKMVKNSGEMLAIRYLKRYYEVFIEPGVEIVGISNTTSEEITEDD